MTRRSLALRMLALLFAVAFAAVGTGAICLCAPAEAGGDACCDEGGAPRRDADCALICCAHPPVLLTALVPALLPEAPSDWIDFAAPPALTPADAPPPERPPRDA